ncbi:MAG: O-antigen ligase family protein, partial [Planctomycetota bacterium]|nr:O-antigen ligase family protein [Planctomycetota bacterium]
MRRFTQIAVALLFAVPLVRLPGMGLDELRIPFWALLTTLLMGRIVYKEARRSEVRGKFDPLRVSLVIFFLVALASLPGGGSLWDALVPMTIFVLGLITYIILTSPLFTGKDLLSWGFPAFAGVALLFSAVIVYQALQGLPVIGTLGNQNRAGALTGMLFPVMLGLSFGGRLRPLYIVTTLALLVATILTDARGGLLGLAAGSAVALGAVAWRWKRTPGLLLVVGGAILVAVLFYPLAMKRVDSIHVRTGLWAGAWEMTLDHPVLGAGLGNFEVEFPPYRGEEEFLISNRNEGLSSFVEAESAHSTWLQIGAEMGFLGVLSFLLILYITVRLWRYFIVHLKSKNSVVAMAGVGGGLVAFLASGLTNTLHLHASHFLFFIIFLASIQLLGDHRPHTRRHFATEVRMAFHGVAALVGGLIILISARQISFTNMFQQGMNQTVPETRIRLLRELISIHDHYWVAHYELGNTYAALNHQTEAERHYKRALEDRPHHVELLDKLGVALARIKGRDAESEDCFKRATEIA